MRNSTRLTRRTMLRAIFRPEEKPQYQPEKRKQHHHDDPKQFLVVGSRALQNVDERPDVTDQNQDPKDPAVAEVDHLEFSLFVPRVAN